MPQTNPFAQELEKRQSAASSDNPFAAELAKREGLYADQAVEMPVEAKRETYTSPLSGFTYERPPTREAEAEAIGIEGGDLGGKVRAAVATGSADDVKNQIALQLDVPVDQVDLGEDPKVGYVYKVPGMEEYQLVDPVGLEAGDIAKGLEVLPAAVGAAAGIVTGAATKSPFTSTAVASVAAAGTKGAQLGVLKEMGIIDPTMQEIGIAMATEGGMEFLGGMAPSIAKTVWKALPTESAARMRTVEEISKRINPEDIAAGRIKTNEVADVIEAETGVRPEFTTGQQIAAVEPERAAAIEGIQDIAEGTVEAQRSQRIAGEALQTKIDTTAEKEFIREEAAAGVREVATGIAESAEKTIANNQARTIQKLEQAKANITQMEAGEAGLAMRTAMEEGNEAAYAPLKSAYGKMDEELADFDIDLDTLRSAARELDKEDIIFGAWAKDSRSAIKQSKGAGKPVTAKQRPMLKSQKQRMAPEVEARPAKFSDVQEALSDIRSKIQVMRDEGASVPEIKRVTRIKEALQQSRDDALKNASPEKANELLNLEAKYAQYKQATNKSLIKAIMKKGSDGRYIVADKAIINNVIKSADDIRMYKQIAQDQPDLNIIPQMREAMLVKYRNQVIDGNGTHRKFMQDNKVAVDELLTPKERAMMKNAERAKTALPAAIKREGQLVKELNDMIPEYELANFQTTKVMDNIKGNVELSNKVKNMLQKRHPEKWKAVQEARKFDVAKQSKTLSGLEGVLNKDRSELITTLGRDYVKTLDAAVELAKTSGRSISGKPIREVDEKGSLGLAQAIVFGPLSHMGFIRNMSSAVIKQYSQRINRELLQDSELLEEVIRAHRMANKNKGMKALASATGLGVWGSENELDVPIKDLN